MSDRQKVPEEAWAAGMEAVGLEPRSAEENARTWRVVYRVLHSLGYDVGATVASVLLHYRAEGNVKNGVPLVADGQKLIKPVRISAAWKWDRPNDRWALAVVKVTGPRLSMDQRGTVPGSERHASWHENDLAQAPEWVRRFVDHNSPEVTDAKRPA